MTKQPVLTSFPHTILATAKRRAQATIQALRESLINHSLSGYAVIFENVLPTAFLAKIDPTTRDRHFGHLPVFWAWLGQILEGNASCTKGGLGEVAFGVGGGEDGVVGVAAVVGLGLFLEVGAADGAVEGVKGAVLAEAVEVAGAEGITIVIEISSGEGESGITSEEGATGSIGETSRNHNRIEGSYP